MCNHASAVLQGAEVTLLQLHERPSPFTKERYIPGGITSFYASRASFVEFVAEPGWRKCLPVRVPEQ